MITIIVSKPSIMTRVNSPRTYIYFILLLKLPCRPISSQRYNHITPPQLTLANTGHAYSLTLSPTHPPFFLPSTITSGHGVTPNPLLPRGTLPLRIFASANATRAAT
jgi:hypothetical protein